MSADQVTISEYCEAKDLEYLSGHHQPPDIEAQVLDRYSRAVDRLIAVYRANPKAVYQPGGHGPKLTMRQVVSDQASALEDCDERDDAARLDRVLRNG